jgi:glycosyltransferase involved in cell wall biosynthesis
VIKVTQIFRKRNPIFFSIEKVFALIRPVLINTIELENSTLPCYSQGFISILHNLYFAFCRRGRGVFHVTGDVHYAVLALPQSRTILTIHDCVFMHTSKGLKRKILKWIFLDMPVRYAGIVTTISESSKQEIIRFTNCLPNKIVVIPNPVNAQIQFKEKTFNTAEPVIFFIGTTPNKNLERVIPALEGINCHLQVLGTLTTEQAQLLAKHRVNFSILQNISEEELAAAYAQTDIVLFPSLFEGFGLPILEGQQAGRVVITSNIDPMKTVAGGGALLVDPYDITGIRSGIQKAINDAVARNRYIEKGFINSSNYDVSSIAGAYQRLYEQAANH